MTETEKKALALVNAVCAEWEVSPATEDEMDGSACFAALTRAIEQHEAFRQEVSDAVEKHKAGMYLQDTALDRFITPKPDPLVEAWLEAFPGNHIDDAREECAKISAALATRGLTITETKEKN